MNRLLMAAVLLAPGIVGASVQDPDVNVNSRYIIESVDVSPKEKASRLPLELQDEIKKLVGNKVDNEKLNELGKRIRSALKVSRVTPKVSKGDQPEHVKVVFEAVVEHSYNLNSSVNKFGYHSRQGFSGTGEIFTNVGENKFSLGLADDGDELLERFAGYKLGFYRKSLGTNRLKLGFGFESYHEQWSRRTEDELSRQTAIPGIYRTRMNFQPVLTIVLAKPLELDAGTSFQRFQTQYPAARTEASDAVVTSLRYHQNWEGPGANRQSLNADYSLHAATKLLDTDYVYTRHQWDADYRFQRDLNAIELHFEGGVIGGTAPLYERFVAGNSFAFRGWHKYDIAPLGGDRIVIGKVDYSYRFFQVFYDTGSIWNQGQSSGVKHSLGVGVKKYGFQLAVAFPVKSGHVDAILMAGLFF